MNYCECSQERRYGDKQRYDTEKANGVVPALGKLQTGPMEDLEHEWHHGVGPTLRYPT